MLTESSIGLVKTFSISSLATPLYDVITDTTGNSISGSISRLKRLKEKNPKTTIIKTIIVIVTGLSTENLGKFISIYF